MTNLEKLAEKKALELLNEVCDERDEEVWTTLYRKEFETTEALFRAVLAHETYRREVSDAVKAVINSAPVMAGLDLRDALARFVVVDEDPLVEAYCKKHPTAPRGEVEKKMAELREAMAECGLKIVEAD